MLLVLAGYVFGIIHKVLYSFDWVTWAYAALMTLVLADVFLYFRNRGLEKSGPGDAPYGQ